MFASRAITATRGCHLYNASAKFKNIQQINNDENGRHFQ
jgi:hypothetical protein